MVKVFSNEKCIETFARKLQTHGRSSNHTIFFEHDVIYSYGHHFPLARIIGNTVLVNSNKVSKTTATHTALVKRKFTENCYDMICVVDPMAESRDEHDANIQEMRDELALVVAKASRARKEEIKNALREQAAQIEYEISMYQNLTV